MTRARPRLSTSVTLAGAAALAVAVGLVAADSGTHRAPYHCNGPLTEVTHVAELERWWGACAAALLVQAALAVREQR